jgi:hypothetical protein
LPPGADFGISALLGLGVMKDESGVGGCDESEASWDEGFPSSSSSSRSLDFIFCSFSLPEELGLIMTELS